MSNKGGDVQAKDINLIAIGDVTLTGVQDKTVTQRGASDTTTVTTTQSLNLKGDNVNIQGVGQNSNVALVAANVDATNKATIAGTGDVTIASAENRTTHEWTTRSEDCNWWGKCTTTVTHGLEDKTTQVGSDIKGGTVEISAGKNLTTVASTIESPGNVSLSAQGTIDYQAALNVDKKDVQSKSSSSWLGIDTSWLSVLGGSKEVSDSSIQTRAATTSLQSEADILSESGGSTRLQGTQVKAGTFTVNAGVGPKADPNAKIIIEGVKETLQTSHTEKSASLVWQSMSGNGVTEETLKLAQINAKTKFSAPGGIDVQLPAGDPLKQQVQSLSQQPGMAWLNDLSQRKDVNWQEIKLAKDSWSYDQQGLTPAGAALLAIAVAAYAPGISAGLSNAVGGGAMATALNAGFVTLQSQAAVALVNNGGDIGKTLKDMGSKDSVKNVVLAMATAGALHGMGETMTIDGQKLSDINVKNSTFGANLGKAVMNNLANATMTSAITGTPLEDNIKTGLVSAFISAGAGSAAFEIGEKTANDQIAKALAHAIAGCVAGAAGQGKGGCSAGATGAVVGELAAQWYDPNGTKKPEDTLNFVKVVTAAAAAITGDGSAASVSTAVMTGVNAAQNNYLNHTQWKQLADKLKTCTPGPDCDAVVKEYTALSGKQDKELADACKDINSPLCRAKISESQVGTLTQKDLVASKVLPDNYLGGADFNANANRYAKTAFLTDLKAECARNASCDAKKTAALTKLGSTVLDFVPVIGDVKAYVEAETPFDYLLATVGMAGPVGDSVAKALREGKALYKAGDVAGATAKLDEAKTIVIDSKGNALIGDWSYSKTLTSPENAQAHWTKHASEFPQYSNAAQYVEGAQAFVANPPVSALKIVRSNGDTVLFDPLSDTFAIKSASGGPRTMFKPDPANHGYPTNLDYFNAQK